MIGMHSDIGEPHEALLGNHHEAANNFVFDFHHPHLVLGDLLDAVRRHWRYIGDARGGNVSYSILPYELAEKVAPLADVRVAVDWKIEEPMAGMEAAEETADRS